MVGRATIGIAEPDAPEVEREAGDVAAVVVEGPALETAAPLSEDTVRAVLEGVGAVMATLVAPEEDPELWRFTPAELDAITPPLTRIANRRPRLRRALEEGDELALALHLAGYAGRNVAAARRLAADRLEADERERETAPAGRHADAGGPGGDPGTAHARPSWRGVPATAG